VTYGCGGSADLAIGYRIFAAKAAYCRHDAASAPQFKWRLSRRASGRLTQRGQAMVAQKIAPLQRGAHSSEQASGCATRKGLVVWFGDVSGG
jgi:hypothetical protein